MEDRIFLPRCITLYNLEGEGVYLHRGSAGDRIFLPRCITRFI